MTSGTILVADDDGAIRTVLNQALSRAGHTVRLTSNVATLWRWVAEGEGDVVITDVVMPGGSGPDLTRRLVALRPELKVVYMSGYTEDAIVKHGVLNPGIAFLHKPFTMDTLSRKLREVLDT